MPPEFDLRQAVKSKLSNDKVSRAMAPLILVSLLVYIFYSKTWHSVNPIPLIVVVLLIVLQELLLTMPKTKNIRYFQSGEPFPLIIYNIFLFVAWGFYLPLYSPFLFAATAIVFITVYFRGLLVLALSILSWALAVIAYTIRHGYPNLPSHRLLPYLTVLLEAALAVVVQRAGSIDNDIRKDLVTASDKMLEKREELNSLINGINDTIIATNLEGQIHFYNSTALNMLSLKSIAIDDDLSKYIRLHDDENDRQVNLLMLVKENPGIKRYRGLHLFDSNNVRVDVSIEVSTVSIKQTQNPTYEFIFVIRDVTREKEIDQERDEFVAITSHELKAPVEVAEANIAFAMSRPLMTSIDEESKMKLKRAHSNVKYLSELIEQLAELSNIESSTQKMTYEDVEPAELFSYLHLNTTSAASDKGLLFNTTIIGDVQPIYTCKEYLAQILQNFLTNAVKYTESGQITLSAEKSKKYPNGILFSVSNIREDASEVDKDKVINKLNKEEDYKTLEERGVSLGLYLALKLARLINGNVWFTPENDNGSTFYLEIEPVNRKIVNGN